MVAHVVASKLQPGSFPLHDVLLAASLADAACQKGKNGCIKCKNNK
jgi:hypothetical protein